MDLVRTVMDLLVIPLLTLVATLVAVDSWLADRRSRTRPRNTQHPGSPSAGPPHGVMYGLPDPYAPSTPYGQAPAYGGAQVRAVPPAAPSRPVSAGIALWAVPLLHVPLLGVGWWHIVAWDSIVAGSLGELTPQDLEKSPVSAFFFVLSGALLCLRLARSDDPAHDGRRWLYGTLLVADIVTAVLLIVLREQIWNYTFLPAFAVFLLLTGWSLPRGRRQYG
ncbi:hypothetical protein GCM10009677_56720 [Sphaerisporangium rubeum]|uniref:Uncharacterized protein n=1 Tax=Sphaerisporangium rubeum TaxID=321317 RepID=A0A7X0ID39_9ACTN|nr:hypothetical protein [Sphaerisporangium rubeum]MBB6473047.1 hypothetical protein [Sphaerisporangium rubeum]